MLDDVTIDDGPVEHWSNSCAGAYRSTMSGGPVGYFCYPDGGPPFAFYDLVIDGGSRS